MGIAVGIDLGTTYSAIAAINEFGKPQIIQVEGRPTLPSVVGFADDATVVVGSEAKEAQAASLYPTASFFKRVMGEAGYVFPAPERDYSAVDLSACVLRKLKAEAELFLGQPVTDAVITVPAYFKASERSATIEAGKLANLNVLQLINEPTAAALAYGIKGVGEAQTLLVYDLGGGTFDVTLLQRHRGGISVISSGGDHRLGGGDWDERILRFAAARFNDQFGVDPLDSQEWRAEMLSLAETIKRDLSVREQVGFSVHFDGQRGRYELSRAHFEELTADLMERSVSLTQSILHSHAIDPRRLDGVLLVGGSTRMPMVRRYIETLTGKPPITGVNVDEAVALGAALMASGGARDALLAASPKFSLPGIGTVQDVTSHSLGMIAVNDDGSAYVNQIILPKDSPVPCSEMRPFKHTIRRRGQLEIFMTQSESPDPADASYLGLYVIREFMKLEGERHLEVTYSYDSNSTVTVTAKDRQSQIVLPVAVEALPANVPARFLEAPKAAKAPEALLVYLAFDVSGSMGGAPLAEAQKAAQGFCDTMDLAHSALGVIAFSDRVTVKTKPLSDACGIRNAIDALSCGETGCCNGAQPFDVVLGEFKNREERKILVVLTDGCWSRQELAVERAKACHAEGIAVIAIGFGTADESFLREIASSEDVGILTTQGRLVETFQTIAQVLSESGGSLSSQDTARIGAIRRL